MRKRSSLAPIVAFVGAILAPLLLTTAFLSPAPRRYDVGTPGDAYLLRNFYSPEESAGATFRWSGLDAALLLPEPYAGAVVLTARLHGNPNLAPVSLYGAARSERLVSIQPTANWRVYRILTPRGQLWGTSGQPGEVRISSEPVTAQPGDPRELGAAIDALEMRPIAGGQAPIAVALRDALLISWGGLLLTAAVWLSARSLLRNTGNAQDGPIGRGGARVDALSGTHTAPAGSPYRVATKDQRRTTRAGRRLAPGPSPLLQPTTEIQNLVLASPEGAAPLDRAMAGFGLILTLGLALWAWRDPDSLRWALPLRWPWLSVASLAVLLLWAATTYRANRQAASSHLPPHVGAFTTIGVALCAHLLLFLPLAPQLRGLAALAILGLPGALLARLLLADEPDRLARIFFGLCGALALPVLLLMALQLIPGPLSPWLLLLLCDAQSALVGWVLWRRLKSGQLSPTDAQSAAQLSGHVPHDAAVRPPSPAHEGGGQGVRATSAPHSQGDGHPLLPLGLIMLLGAALRLPFLGGAELHDDEATAITAAARLVAGQADQLLIQLKGPAQVLLPAGPMALTGQAGELVARMPFALAGLGVILGGYLLASQLLGLRCERPSQIPTKDQRPETNRPAPWALVFGLWSRPEPAPQQTGAGPIGAAAPLMVALLLALDGFLIAFSRVIQYQSVVLLMGLGAALCCLRFFEGRGRSLPLLSAAAVMIAVALLGHYDGIYIVPALAWLVLAGGRRRGWGLAQWVRELALPAALGAALLGSFYVPFALHPHFSEVAAHIGERSGQDAAGWALYNNLAGSAFLASFYHTTPLLWAMGGGLAVTLAGATVAYVRPRPLGYPLAGLTLLVAADLLRGAEGSLLLGAPGLVALLCALPLLGLLLAPATPATLRFGLIWFISAAVSVGFLLAQPRTHMHVIDIPAALLIGWGLAAAGRWAARRERRWPGAALALAAAALLAVATPYAYALFVRQSPEYQRGFPMARLAAYPARAADRAAEPIGGNGRLGYPSQDGWKTVGELYRRGMLRGAFASNQSAEVAAWYTRGIRRCGATPDYYIIASALRNPAIPADAFLFGTVSVHGQHQLWIYSRSRPDHPPYHFDSANFAAAFDAQPTPRLPPVEEVCAQG